MDYYTSIEDAIEKNHIPEHYCKIMIEECIKQNPVVCAVTGFFVLTG